MTTFHEYTDSGDHHVVKSARHCIHERVHRVDVQWMSLLWNWIVIQRGLCPSNSSWEVCMSVSWFWSKLWCVVWGKSGRAVRGEESWAASLSFAWLCLALLDRHQLEGREWSVLGLGYGWITAVVGFSWDPVGLSPYPGTSGRPTVQSRSPKGGVFASDPAQVIVVKYCEDNNRQRVASIYLTNFAKTTFDEDFWPERVIIPDLVNHCSCQPRETVVPLDIPLGAMQVHIWDLSMLDAVARILDFLWLDQHHTYIYVAILDVQVQPSHIRVARCAGSCQTSSGLTCYPLESKMVGGTRNWYKSLYFPKISWRQIKLCLLRNLWRWWLSAQAFLQVLLF